MTHSSKAQTARTPSSTFDPTALDFIECSCGGEGVAIALDESAPYDITLSFWTMSLKGKQISFLDRLRFCWRVLLTGSPWTDMVCISQQNISRLVSSLLKRRIS